jgi:hypothetical protein
MDAFKLPLPAVWIEPIWLVAQILLILLAGYFAQRFVAKCRPAWAIITRFRRSCSCRCAVGCAG